MHSKSFTGRPKILQDLRADLKSATQEVNKIAGKNIVPEDLVDKLGEIADAGPNNSIVSGSMAAGPLVLTRGRSFDGTIGCSVTWNAENVASTSYSATFTGLSHAHVVAIMKTLLEVENGLPKPESE